jgi:hypothetical protein
LDELALEVGDLGGTLGATPPKLHFVPRVLISGLLAVAVAVGVRGPLHTL